MDRSLTGEAFVLSCRTGAFDGQAQLAFARRCAARHHVAQPVAALLVDVAFELEAVRLVSGAERVLAEYHVECASGRCV